MDIKITGRNVEINDSIKDRVESRLLPVIGDYPRVESCHVICTNEKYRFTAAVVVQGRDKMHLEAEETSSDLYASIDAAADRIDKQLRKSRDKMIARGQERQRLADAEPPPAGL